jgi:hypothetical protein
MAFSHTKKVDTLSFIKAWILIRSQKSGSGSHQNGPDPQHWKKIRFFVIAISHILLRLLLNQNVEAPCGFPAPLNWFLCAYRYFFRNIVVDDHIQTVPGTGRYRYRYIPFITQSCCLVLTLEIFGCSVLWIRNFSLRIRIRLFIEFRIRILLFPDEIWF